MTEYMISILTMLSIKAVHIHGFVPEIHMPFEKKSGHSIRYITKLKSSLTCDEERSSLKDCATECFSRSLTNVGCPAFHKATNENDVCHLCHVSNYSDVEGNIYTTLNSNAYIYLLRKRQVIPEVYMDFENYSSTNIFGKGTLGTKVNVEESDHVSGIKGEALHIHSFRYVTLTGSGTECWTNLDHCSSGITASIWFYPKSLAQFSNIVNSAKRGNKGFNIQTQSDQYVYFHVFSGSHWFRLRSSRTISENKWYFLTAVYKENYEDDNVLITVYIDGMNHSGPFTITEETNVDGDWGARIGIKDSPTLNNGQGDHPHVWLCG